MDFGLREILFFIGLVFIVGILFDGLRRMRKSKGELFGLPPDYDQIETGRNSPDFPVKDQLRNSAEVIDLRESADGIIKPSRTTEDESKVTHLDNSHSVSHETVEEESFNEELPNGGARKVLLEESASIKTKPQIEPEVGEFKHVEREEREERQEAFENRPPFLHEVDVEEDEYADEPALAVDPEIQDVIIFNIVAKNKGTFSGQTLVKAAEMCHLELGDMHIFHRYEASGNPSSSRREKIFSMANLVEPGTFDPDTLHDFKSPGVCLFMQLPGPKRSIAALERMVDTARKLAIKLGAEMRDDHHSVITPQTIEHYRQRVMEFERKRRTRRHAELSH